MNHDTEYERDLAICEAAKVLDDSSVGVVPKSHLDKIEEALK